MRGADSTGVQQLGEVAYDDVRAVLAQRVGLAGAIDSHHPRKAAGAASTSRQFVLEETTARENPASRTWRTYRTDPS